MIRVVLDTNILVSALLSPNGPPAQVLVMSLVEPDMQLCISASVYAEYEEVIRRPRFKRTEREIESALRSIRERAVWVRPTAQADACPDPDDNIFLECALAAAAHYLVTGNTKHFPPYLLATTVVTARQFLDAIA